ncbi:hypothetical protein GCM10010502_05360 [Kitasatospora aureofaciens]|uniref:Uncharacterized protein n=1 Tax=Kitasatospora aureofaciens TaxID=1894 RepID=A0A8H9HCN1_KITAU|nr:hypothetical protein GCM10010502_05360 [Kitasatospora aureofaciens]
MPQGGAEAVELVGAQFIDAHPFTGVQQGGWNRLPQASPRASSEASPQASPQASVRAPSRFG